jgi:hypothetical protein
MDVSGFAYRRNKLVFFEGKNTDNTDPLLKSDDEQESPLVKRGRTRRTRLCSSDEDEAPTAAAAPALPGEAWRGLLLLSLFLFSYMKRIGHYALEGANPARYHCKASRHS